ncbi:hypothetical protein EON65_29120, partial [archaeon]
MNTECRSGWPTTNAFLYRETLQVQRSSSSSAIVGSQQCIIAVDSVSMAEVQPVLAPGLSNIVYIFVTFFLMLWFFKAFTRFWRALRIRHGFLTERLANIIGVGSYLSYFEGATRAHLHAVAHTRQAMPPEKLKLVYVPYIMYKTQVVLSNNKDKAYLKIQLHCPSDCTVLCLTHFNFQNFKRRLTTLYTKSSQLGQRTSSTTRTSSSVNALGSVRAEMEMGKFLREQLFEMVSRVGKG